MDRKVVYGIVLILIIAVIAFLFSMYGLPGPGTVPGHTIFGPSGGIFSIKPAEYSLAPGEMIAVVMGVENNDPGKESLYYNFGFEGERAEWILIDDDPISVAPDELGLKDSVVRVPADALPGKYVFNVYACYSQNPGVLDDCGRNSQNLWASPWELAITVES